MTGYLCKGAANCYPGVPVGLLLGVGLPLAFVAYGYLRGRVNHA